MYQSSPGGQSSCSSEPSPLGSATHHDGGVELRGLSGGNMGDLNALDDTPLVDSTVSTGMLGLHLRKNASPAHKLTQLKQEKLKSVRDSCSWSNPAPSAPSTRLPPINTSSLLDGSGGLCDPGISISSPRLGDLCPGETTLLSELLERRDSLASTVSSAYTLSRRSSGISPCYSSRRSSQASQPGGRLNNISSADSYDPISTDLSRRSSEASQCGGVPSLLSLTPAQHYRLKAKYAAATGGAPPTPLPYMDSVSLKTRIGLFGDSHEIPIHPPTVPRRCSDTSYASKSMFPHEVTGNFTRRASDPVRRVGTEQNSLHQRYNSMNNVNTHPSLHHLASSRSFNSVSENNLNRMQYPARPPSISENVAMETMENDMDNQNYIAEDAMMLPDDVQPLNTLNVDSAQHQGLASYYPPRQGNQSFGLPQEVHYQRRLALVEGIMNTASRQAVAPGSQQTFSRSPNPTKSQMPVQWNEVSSGTVDSSRTSQSMQQSGRGNLQPVQNLSHFQNANSNPQIGLMSHNFAHTVQQSRTRQGNPEYLQGYHQGSASSDIDVGLLTSHNSRVTTQLPTGKIQATFPNNQANYSQMSQQGCGIQTRNPTLSENHGLLQPRPPTKPKPNCRLLSKPITTAGNLLGYPQSNFSESYEANTKQSGDLPTNGMFYTAKIHMLDSRSVRTMAGEIASVGSPETNQVSSTVDSNESEHPQIDFDIMLDDGDHSSLMSGTLSPALLRSLSQTSSRLTTPRNSVTLPTVPAGISNMAIGDMSSMLTKLAEESKFLNMMS
ncbi:hypothetical protein DNTS_018865 [Danionella cerebrum]|uniref:Uncharacterized protein n=1 Tax=Danionella cerebrum TaxID=2873325 RepID=A0A553QES2_9TELE|nr:hypothetical protein DNTS_018865 [Danionella translucida]TRY88433.1 hypothetical protein DNTS_018865 [Danionella translucida]